MMINKIQETQEEKQTVVPNHIAIIMDGNRRWAKNKNLPIIFGHQKGVDALKDIAFYCKDIGVKYLTVYAFSTENWSRGKEEVDALFSLMSEVIETHLISIINNNVKLNVIGFYNELPSILVNKLNNAIEISKSNTGINLQVAINYGSRAEIVNSIKQISSKVLAGEIKIDEINEDTVNQYLFTSEIPSPSLLIRTGGEFRISNFLLWQSAYTEFYFTDVLWPDFSRAELDKAIENYQSRQRRFGK